MEKIKKWRRQETKRKNEESSGRWKIIQEKCKEIEENFKWEFFLRLFTLWLDFLMIFFPIKIINFLKNVKEECKINELWGNFSAQSYAYWSKKIEFVYSEFNKRKQANLKFA